MRKIVYYVASSLDGFIAGSNDDVSSFAYDGSGNSKYREDLNSFDTVIMGRKTYEFGYKFGAKPGEPSPAYPHMKHYIFSNNLKFENPHSQVQVKRLKLNEIEKIQKEAGTDIYLCGGGQFAGWLLEHQKIAILKVKLNPVVLGRGTKLFENLENKYQLHLINTTEYEKGLQLMTYAINYETK